jgi:iron complex outermembrane receptor protein
LITPAEIIGRDKVADGLRRLRLRGTANSAFRAPSLYESYPGFITSIQQFNGEGPTPVFRPVRLNGNPDVKPEKATVLTGGLEWSPIKEFGLTGNYWYYNYRDMIIAEDAQHIYALNKNDPRIERDASGNLLRVNTTGENAAFIRTQGVDLGALIKLDLNDLGITRSPAGTVSLGTEGTYVFAFDIPRDQVADVPRTGKSAIPQPGCNASRCDVAGLRNQNNFAYPLPRLRANFPLTWVYEGHAASVVLHYISGYKDDGNPDAATGAFPHIDSFTTLDLSYGYTLKDTIGQATTLRVGVLNLFDTMPPYVKVFGGFDIYTHDPRGRMIFAHLSQEF